jgi:hypothetical protein
MVKQEKKEEGKEDFIFLEYMSRRGIMLSEISQTQKKNIAWSHSYVRTKK